MLTTAAGLALLGCSSPYGSSYSDYTRESVVVTGPPPVERQVIVTTPPPPRTAEPVESVVGTRSTVSTRPGYVWIDGNWVWKSNGWQWQEGHWERQPYRDARWVPGHYSYPDGRHIYVPGDWTR